MPDGALVLNARIGRTVHRAEAGRAQPLRVIADERGDKGASGPAAASAPGAANDSAGGRGGGGERSGLPGLATRSGPLLGRLRNRIARFPAAVALLGTLVLALWPHWTWMARRLTDGSDEPWGVLAVVTVLVLVAREWRQLAMPSRKTLVIAAALVVTAAVARNVLLPIVAAAIGMAALATFLAAARRDRPALPLASLLLLALPVIASLQFYFGYPLRVTTAAVAAPMLHALGFAAQAQGAALVYNGRTVLVDPPCAGIGMLWVGAYTAALLSYLANVSPWHTARNAAVAAVSVFVANVARNVALFFPEGLDLHWPAWAHPAIGLVAFGLALIPIGLVASAPAPRNPVRPDQWPTRFHRRPA
jgi:exosortase/archaeosortase family protein